VTTQDAAEASLTPTVTFLGHAGFDFRHAGVRLVVDPWLVGTAFDNGWELLFPAPTFDPTGITHIWFSHEHPDHFSPPTLKLIPSHVRAKITVVIQRCADRRLAEFVSAQGYGKVIEAEDGVVVPLQNTAGKPAGSITTVACGMGDSCHLLKLGDIRILNTNDCAYGGPEEFLGVLEKLGATTAPIDLLLSQFSYANWIGNPDESELRKKFAEHKLELLDQQIVVAKPRHTFPCASFIVFAHEENAYLNDHSNDAGIVCERLIELGTTPILAGNGETFDLTTEGFAEMASKVPAIAETIAAEMARVRNGSRKLLSNPAVTLPELSDAATGSLQRLRNGVSRIDFGLMQLQLPKAVFELRDHDVLFLIDRLHKVTTAPKGTHRADALISSSALLYALKNDFGFETLLINGRFEKLRPGGEIPILKLTGHFGYLRRKESLAKSIIDRKVRRPLIRQLRLVR
jgi:UDP-MurNAc hydroxylase